MSQVKIEIETAIRNLSWASFQAGQKSMQTITVDFKTRKVTWEYLTGKTNILCISLGSVRDDFRLEGTRFDLDGIARFKAVGQTASAVQVMPNINYEFYLEVSPTSLLLRGEHDGYPSYRVVANGATIYDYVQGHVGQLLGSKDITVHQKAHAVRAR